MTKTTNNKIANKRMENSSNEVKDNTNIISASTKNYSYWYKEAQNLRHQGKLKESEYAYRRAIELEPNHSDVWYNYASLEMLLENLSESRKAYNKALFLNLGQ